ncbi:MAG: SCO family protein [Bacteroidota bacterium]|nr:SCO family protein [Bacteroidota bacterium]
MDKYLVLLFVLSITISCKTDKLPILGNKQEVNGQLVHNQIPDFHLTNQFNQSLRREDLKNKAHLAVFFFTSCPSICPKMMRGLMDIEETYHNEKRLAYLCYSLDYRRDSIPRLKEYYDKLGIENEQFYLLQGKEKKDIYDLSDEYMSITIEDDSAPGGFDHSGWIILVDRDFHVRSYCLGTDPKEIDRMKKDIKTLLNEMD